jgi:hypothetical protein
MHKAEPDLPIESSLCSTSSCDFIRLWLKECSTTHELCRPDIRSSIAPTRLLSLAKGMVRLVHAKDLPAPPLYFTLSHCWGRAEIFKLTRQNIKLLCIEICEDVIYKTFRDAIKVTRGLGFEYLWIDSLCIIQDDTEDWRREASMMGHIYGGSFLNIAASRAEDGRGGLFFQRTDDELRRIQRFQIEVGRGPTCKWFNCIDHAIDRADMDDSPLAKRGWTFQERFLAPRTAHFAKSRLYWECKHKTSSETFQNGFPKTNKNTLERNDNSQIWSSVIEHYSRRNLTFSSDRLVAISGVAKWLQKRTGYEYVAGLWRKNLEQQLLWTTSLANDSRCSRRPRRSLPS